MPPKKSVGVSSSKKPSSSKPSSSSRAGVSRSSNRVPSTSSVNNAARRGVKTSKLEHQVMKEDEVRKLWLRKEEESRRKKVGRRLDELERSNYREVPIDFSLKDLHSELPNQSQDPNLELLERVQLPNTTTNTQTSEPPIDSNSTQLSSRANAPRRSAAKAATLAVSSAFAPVPPLGTGHPHSAVNKTGEPQRNKPGPKPKAKIQDFSQVDNNKTAPTLAPSTLAKKRSIQTANVRRILNYKKGLNTLLEEASSHPLFNTSTPTATYHTSTSLPSTYPIPQTCTVCGYWGDSNCIRCGDRLCGNRCGTTHQETRCERAAY